ncbi:MAG: aldolase/citrate lyase family protein [Kiloniellales bacterium]
MTQPLKQRLLGGETVFGFWHMTASPMVAEILAQAGYDTCIIDMEHGAGSYMDAQTSAQAMAASGCQPLLRVPVTNRVEIKRALDIGAVGVVCPGIASVAEAEEAARACRYPPNGVRGMAPTIVRPARYGSIWQDYIDQADRDVICICQVETKAAVDSIDEIAAIDGVDMLFIGPMDLSGDLGQRGQPDHPIVDEAMAKVAAAAKKNGKALGSIPTAGRGRDALLAAGYSCIIADADVALLRDGAAASLARLRG